MKHSSPALLFGFIPIVSIIIITPGVVIWWLLSFVFYLWVGLLIWVVLLPDPPVFWKCLLMWWPAITLDKPELIDKTE